MESCRAAVHLVALLRECLRAMLAGTFFWSGILIFCTATLAGRPTAAASPSLERQRLSDFDLRREAGAVATQWTAEQKAALEDLRKRVPELEADIDPIIGSPKWLRVRRGFLTGPNGEGNAVSPK